MAVAYSLVAFVVAVIALTFEAHAGWFALFVAPPLAATLAVIASGAIVSLRRREHQRETNAMYVPAGVIWC